MFLIRTESHHCAVLLECLFWPEPWRVRELQKEKAIKTHDVLLAAPSFSYFGQANHRSRLKQKGAGKRIKVDEVKYKDGGWRWRTYFLPLLSPKNIEKNTRDLPTTVFTLYLVCCSNRAHIHIANTPAGEKDQCIQGMLETKM